MSSLGFHAVDPNCLACMANGNGTSRDTIKVLVCTANMGNEAPNFDSLNAWIPNDGVTKCVLESQKYPLREAMKEKFKAAVLGISKSTEIEAAYDYDNEISKFDIIAIGMQEATFEVSEETKVTPLSKFTKKLETAVEQVTKNKNYQEEKATLRNIRNIRHRLASRKSLASTQSLESSAFTPSGILETLEEHIINDGESDRGHDDTRLLHHMLQEHLPSYTRVVSYQRGQMRMIIFYNEDTITLDVLSVKAQNTGRAGLANKGGIVAECDINSGTRISFLSAHLEAHEGTSKYNTRCSTIADIFKGTVSTLADSYCDVSMTSHFTFVMGDLNFRTRLPDHELGSDEHIEDAHNLTAEKNWNTLNKHDELSLALKNKECLVGFSTPRCDFPPTFKVERKDGYSYNPKRSPSYTDRICYKANHLLSEKIKVQAYEPIDHFTTSDHKPLRGAFELQLNSTLKWRPTLKKGHKNFRHSFRHLHGNGKFNFFNANKLPDFESKFESLHLFLSSIECKIEQGVLPSSVYCPSPTVTCISTPSGAIIKNVNTIGINWRTFFKDNKPSVFHMDRGTQVKMRWPHTEPISNTLNPKWKGEMNFKVRTHDNFGHPVNLTGAMLHVMVLDSRDNFNILGSCTINLASLIDSSRKPKVQNSKILEQASSTDTKSSLAMSFAARLLGLVKSQKDVTKREVSNGNEENFDSAFNNNSTNPNPLVHKNTAPPSSLSSLKEEKDSFAFSSSVQGALMSRKPSIQFNRGSVRSVQIDEVLTKNGLDVGNIKFNMDTWWVDDGEFDNCSKEWRGR